MQNPDFFIVLVQVGEFEPHHTFSLACSLSGKLVSMN